MKKDKWPDKLDPLIVAPDTAKERKGKLYGFEDPLKFDSTRSQRVCRDRRELEGEARAEQKRYSWHGGLRMSMDTPLSLIQVS